MKTSTFFPSPPPPPAVAIFLVIIKPCAYIFPMFLWILRKKKKTKPPSSVLGFPQLAFKVNPPEDHVEKSSTLREKKTADLIYIYPKMEYIPLVNINI